MLFSIITVCKNEADTIEDTIQSILSQSFKDYEIIIIDSASDDGTLEILSKYKSFIHKYISEEDNGIYQAMNKGLHMAHGEYVYFLNGGDTLYKNDTLTKVSCYLGNNDLVYGDIFIEEKEDIRIYPSEIGLKFFKRNMLPHQATFYRRSLFENFGYYDETYRIAGDYEFNTRIFKLLNPSCYYINLPLAVFTSGGISSDKKHRELRKAENHRIRFKYFPTYRISVKSFKQIVKSLSKKVINR